MKTPRSEAIPPSVKSVKSVVEFFYHLSFIIYNSLNQKHRVAVAEETVAPLHRLAVGPEN